MLLLGRVGVYGIALGADPAVKRAWWVLGVVQQKPETGGGTDGPRSHGTGLVTYCPRVHGGL